MNNSEAKLRSVVKEGITAHVQVVGTCDMSGMTCNYDGVYETKILEIFSESISYIPIFRFGEKIQLKPGNEVEMLFYMNDNCYKYSGEVTETNGEYFKVEDANSVTILNLRENVLINSNIACTYLPLSNEGKPPKGVEPFSCRIIDIGVGGVGIICDSRLEPGTKVQLNFTFPESTHGGLKVYSNVNYTKTVLIRDKERFRSGLQFTEISRIKSQQVFEWILQQIEKMYKSDVELCTADTRNQSLLELAKDIGIKTVWDRTKIMQPQCAFGTLGTCCRTCLQGPCRIDSFGDGAKNGICGLSADTMVTRGLVRMIASGASAHIEHTHHLLEVLEKIGKKKKFAYKITEENKLRKVAERIGIKTGPETTTANLAAAVAQSVEKEFFNMDDSNVCTWIKTTLTDDRIKRLAKHNLLPNDLYSSIIDLLHRTHTGVDTNPTSLLLAGLRCSMVDYTGMHIATDISDILFGVPTLQKTFANLAVIDEKAVNIAVHGHNPLVTDLVCQEARNLNSEAVDAGAPHGINVVGICCTGNELLARRGVPLAGNFASQEVAILTGALDAIIVDYQCVIPSIVKIAECFHTKIITTLPMGRLPDSPSVTHIEFDMNDPSSQAIRVIRDSIEAFKQRNPNKISIPKGSQEAIVGFSTESIISILAKLNQENPLQPLIANIAEGNIQGIALMAGCNNALVRQDHNIITIAKGLIKENVLVLATGCCGGALAKAGLMSSKASKEIAGPRLKKVLGAIGEAAGLEGLLPPVLHLGSCVNNSRAVDIAVAVANALGVDLDALPVVASAPELMSEKAVSIGTFAVTLGFPVHLGIIPPVNGAKEVVSLLTEEVKNLVGGYFIIEPNPLVAVERLLKVIKEKRAALKI